MKFRDDIDPANTWVVSDTHFGHENIVGFCHRPEDHEQVIIAEWRAAVPDDATVLHLGDLSYKGNARFKHLLSKELTGARKLLIKGNHDRGSYKFYKDCGFKLALPFAIIWNEYNNVVDPAEFDSAVDHVVSFSHYSWSDEEEGRPMFDYDTRIHGHIHNNGYTRNGFVPFLKNHINMSVEQTKFRPVNLKLLLEAALLGKYERTTEEQIEEARMRSAMRRSRRKAS